MIYYSNEINFLRELQKPNGSAKFEEYRQKLDSTFKVNLKLFMMVLIIVLAMNYFTYKFRKCTFAIILIIILHLVVLFLSKEYLNRIYNSFIVYCNNIVKFEDYARVIIKIHANSNTQFFEEKIENLIQGFQSRKFGEFREHDPEKNKWDEYLKFKLKSFAFIFDRFESFYCHGKRLYIKFYFELPSIFKLTNNLESISELLNHTLIELKKKYDDYDPHFDENNCLREVVNKILENSTKDKRINLVFANQLAEVVQNNKSLVNEYLNLIELLMVKREDNDNNQEKIVDKFDAILENQYNTTNTIKQIKYNYANSEKNLKAENKQEVIGNMENTEKLEETNKRVSLYEIELNPHKKNDKNDESNTNNRINITPISHFEIMRRAEESRNLQFSLLCDLEEFQRSKQPSNEEDINPGLTLESLLNS